VCRVDATALRSIAQDYAISEHVTTSDGRATLTVQPPEVTMLKPRRYPPPSRGVLALAAFAIALELAIVLALVATGSTPGQVLLGGAVLGFVPLFLLATALLLS
jgi:hypothetical protein